ncbi:trehalase family glycosidase [Granulicella sp. S156]|uniref:MGH1-like glycoside hydrolase domain-containing protein n=1 Tax=Granulicella sp. S156 TaxID=1747224 RepID=UPI00131E49A7|nr:trehalase family glycosidase [Granulicella sp. S156]
MTSNLSRRTIIKQAALSSGGLLLSSAFKDRGSTVLASDTSSERTDRDRLLQYFAANARKLLRNPMGVLHQPSISPSLPGAEYVTSLWDWDTLWTARGLFRVAELTNDAMLKHDVAEHARGCIANFFDHQSAEGRIPMLISVDDPDPLGCLRGKTPHIENQAKPVMAQLGLLITEQTGDAKWFEPYLSKLIAFYRSWSVNNLSKTGLYVWGDDVAIGNDNDPTTFGRPFFSSANLLLNCLYYQDLKAAAEIARQLGRSEEQRQFQHDVTQLGAAIQKECWDARDKFFYTADVQCVDRRAELIPKVKRGMAMSWDSVPLRIQTFTGFLPMWCELATQDQAVSLVEHLRNQNTLGAKYGVRTLSRAERMYSVERSGNPSNWLGPIWIISNYLAWKGLVNYKCTVDAAKLASSTVALLAKDLETSGSLNEYYHPDTGAALSHKGFMDWNLLVLEMI